MISESQQDDIILEHLNLIYRYVTNFTKGGLRHFRDDMLGVAIYELVVRVRALESLHPNMEAFLISCVKSRLLDFLRKEKLRSYLPLDEALIVKKESNCSLDEELDALKLNHLRRQIVWYMLQGYKQFEIADVLGIGTATISREIAEIRSQINEGQI